MSQSVFFSWQSDTVSKVGRNFIEQALNRAVGAINSDLEIQDADRPDTPSLLVDKDTQGVAGSPSIVDTILGKIDGALCFVGDLTFVAQRANGGGVPNPNVMVEYGYVLRALGENRVLSVMNEAYGVPSKENMPFDLAHTRFPVTYKLSADATSGDRNEEVAKLAKILERALRAVLDHHLSTVPEVKPAAFPAKSPGMGKARFRPPISDTDNGTQIGWTEQSFVSTSRALILEDDPAMYLRVFPAQPQNREWTLPELKRMENGPRGLVLLPFQYPTSRFNAEDGVGWYTRKCEDGDPVESESVVIAFTTGEIWSIDTSYLRYCSGKIWLNPIVDWFSEKLEAYGLYLQSLGVEPPFSWIAGFEDIEGRRLGWDAPPGRIMIPGFERPCQAKGFEVAGSYAPGEAAREALRPFFETLCHTSVLLNRRATLFPMLFTAQVD
ncbi:hypothetical protein P8936_06470 [Edaphobacter paludis]|uniref:Uncharacterized protein n=1 Tax=Edaphobacter paludis TaxID=3035702 RepID=A0AAU7DBQ6_9BACT